jgi:hypothetical protein
MRIREIIRKEQYFLSIDIDFFNELFEGDMLYKWLCELHRECMSRGIPISACMNHQQMLKLVNKSTARSLINVDQHSDIYGETDGVITCATWVDYVRWIKDGTYTWVAPGNGFRFFDCGDLFSMSKKKRRITSMWNNIFLDMQSNPSPKLLASNAVEVCVCMSPSYSYENSIKLFRKWVKDTGIRYRKGWMDEYTIRRMAY